MASISKVLIANRGEISCRIQKACKKLGLDAVAVFTEPDALSGHVLGAKESVCLGESPKEYLNAQKLIEVALATGEAAAAAGMPPRQACCSSEHWSSVCTDPSHLCDRQLYGKAEPTIHKSELYCSCRLPGCCPRLWLPIGEHRLFGEL